MTVDLRSLAVTVLTASIVALAAPVCAGCSKGKAGGDGGVDVSGTALKSKDGRFQVTLPKSWHTSTGLNAEASIEAEGPEGYLVVLTDPKEDLADPALPKYATSRAQAIVKNIEGGKIGPQLEVSVGGHRALQSELSGTTKGIHVMYLLTVVETPSHLHQVLAWTTKSKFSSSRPKLANITATFSETTPGL